LLVHSLETKAEGSSTIPSEQSETIPEEALAGLRRSPAHLFRLVVRLLSSSKNKSSTPPMQQSFIEECREIVEDILMIALGEIDLREREKIVSSLCGSSFGVVLPTSWPPSRHPILPMIEADRKQADEISSESSEMSESTESDAKSVDTESSSQESS
jgi:hypothetical protein